MPDFVGAVDQGTTSTRFMIFDHSGNVKGIHQLEHEQILPQAGWVEHNPTEIWSRTETVVKTALQQANLQRVRPGRGRRHQPAGDRGGVEQEHRPAATTTRSSGRTPAPTGSPRPWSGRARAT